MKKQATCLLRNQWRQFWCLANDWKPHCLANFRPFRPPRRFSAWLWGTSWRPQLWQQFVHASSHLLGRRFAMLRFPRTQLSCNDVACQDQKIMDDRDNPTPPLEAFRGAHLRLIPQQALFIETIAVFLTETINIAQSHLSHIRLLVSDPDEPTDPWITLFVGRIWTHHANDA